MAKYTIHITIKDSDQWIESNNVQVAWHNFYQRARKGNEIALFKGGNLIAMATSKKYSRCWFSKNDSTIFDKSEIFTEREIRRNKVIEKVYHKNFWKCPVKAIEWTEQ